MEGGHDLLQVLPDLSSLKAAQDAEVPTLNYGLSLQSAIDFVIMAFAIFLPLRTVNRLQRPEPAAPAAPTIKDFPYCLSSLPLKATRCGHCTSQLGTAY